MDIGAGKGYPQGNLSNFTPRRFIFDGVECCSMEGLLQSFKFDKQHIQEEVCKLTGLKAKFKGKNRNKAWKSKQTLWWKGLPIERNSDEYQNLLNMAYQAMYDQCESFRNALDAAKGAVLTHSIGNSKESETVLTEREFCSRLTKLRDNKKL